MPYTKKLVLSLADFPENQWLWDFFEEQYKNQKVRQWLPNTIYKYKNYKFTLKYEVFGRHRRSRDYDKSQQLLHENKIAYEEVAANSLGSGYFGMVFPILNTLSENRESVPVVSNKKSRVVKKQHSIDRTSMEAKFTARNIHLHSKYAEKNYLVMAFINGKPLTTCLNENLSIEQKLTLARNLAKAIKEQVIDLNILHNDLLNNILVNPDTFEITIIDYGISEELISQNNSENSDLVEFFWYLTMLDIPESLIFLIKKLEPTITTLKMFINAIDKYVLLTRTIHQELLENLYLNINNLSLKQPLLAECLRNMLNEGAQVALLTDNFALLNEKIHECKIVLTEHSYFLTPFSTTLFSENSLIQSQFIKIFKCINQILHKGNKLIEAGKIQAGNNLNKFVNELEEKIFTIMETGSDHKIEVFDQCYNFFVNEVEKNKNGINMHSHFSFFGKTATAKSTEKLQEVLKEFRNSL